MDHWLVLQWEPKRSAQSVMVISIGNALGDPSSKPGWGCLHFTSFIMNPSIPHSVVGKY